MYVSVVSMNRSEPGVIGSSSKNQTTWKRKEFAVLAINGFVIAVVAIKAVVLFGSLFWYCYFIDVRLQDVMFLLKVVVYESVIINFYSIHWDDLKNN